MQLSKNESKTQVHPIYSGRPNIPGLPVITDAVRVLRPDYVFVENVAALLRRGFDTVHADLAALGYDTSWICLRAYAE
jgi:hypothetical protein